MGGFLDSLNPILNKHRAESFFLASAFAVSIISLLVFAASFEQKSNNNLEIEGEISEIGVFKNYVVDIEGAVVEPNVYEVSPEARLRDLLILAGGLSADADRIYFSKNFNLAKKLKDQEKIYIPNIVETENNLLSQDSPVYNQTVTTNQNSININSASMNELDSLPNIGKITAQKIMQSRPYQDTRELLDKKIVNNSTYEKIKDLISIN